MADSELRSSLIPMGSGRLVLSGALLGLAHPPFDLLLPSFVALVPFALWLADLSPGREGRLEAWRGGLFLGGIYYTLVFYWLLTALIPYSALAIFAFLAPVLALSALLAAVTLAIQRVRDQLGWPLWLALPVFWTAAEWARAHVPQIGLAWMGLGDTLTGFPQLIGVADVVGSRGITFWLVLANALLAGCILRYRAARATSAAEPASSRRAVVRPAFGLLLVLAFPIGYSVIRWNGLDLRPVARVAIVQPNVAQAVKRHPGRSIAAARASSDTLLASLEPVEARRLDLIIFPETMLNAPIEPIPATAWRGRPDLEAWIGGFARRFDARILYGGLGARETGGAEFEYLNSAFLTDEAGVRTARYDKRYLVPVVERVPFLNPSWFRRVDYFGGFGVGEPAAPLETGTARIGVMICYESSYTGLSRAYRRQGADYLVNMTNDAWFGRAQPAWSRSSALWQHPAHLVMRSIETRIGAARSANTGISGVVDPLGRFQEVTTLFEPAAFAADVLTTEGRTLYVRFGDVVGWLSGAAALGAWSLATRRRRDSVDDAA